MGHHCCFCFLFDSCTSVRVNKIESTILKLLQKIKGYYQCVSAIYCLVKIISERESKVKEPCRYQEMSVKWKESVQSIYSQVSGLRLGPNNIRVSYRATLLSSFLHSCHKDHQRAVSSKMWLLSSCRVRNMVIAFIFRINF